MSNIVNLFKSKSVIPIPAFFDKNQELVTTSYDKRGCKNLCNYLDYLAKQGGKILMTTAGTTSFNLLFREEIVNYGKWIYEYWNALTDTEGYMIIGLPKLSEKKMIEQIRWLNHKMIDYKKNSRKNLALLIQYPERYYRREEIVDYFINIADCSNFPIFIHAEPIRGGCGSYYTNYSTEDLLEIYYKSNKKVCGIKEEQSNLLEASNLVSELLPEFITIAAGSSMRRHMAIKSTTFLSGVGNIRPDLENAYLSDYKHQLLGNCWTVIDTCEKPFFDIMMFGGWHKSLRTAIRILGFDPGYRKPMIYYSACMEEDEIKNAIKVLKEIL